MREFNFEIYVKNAETGENGWDIHFVQFMAENKEDAKAKLASYPNFDCIITADCGGHEPYDVGNGFFRTDIAKVDTNGEVRFTKNLSSADVSMVYADGSQCHLAYVKDSKIHFENPETEKVLKPFMEALKKEIAKEFK